MELHLEFRPRNFDEIIGNKSILDIIKSKLQEDQDGNNNFPHAVMLHGPKGSGKTTIARLIAKELGCDPESNSTDFQELDIVHVGGIDTAREIRENINYAPMDQKCRVYILDEFHASKGGKFQEGLLKPFEETPPHIYFIVCTTEPQKVLSTIRSRCAKYKVESLNEKQLKNLINWVLDELEMDIDEEIIEEIIDNADGCPREALVTLDSIIDLDPDKMLDAIQGNETQREVREICQAMLKNQSWAKMAKMLKQMKGLDAEKARYAVLGYMQTVLLSNSDKSARAALIMDYFKESVMYSGMPGFVCYVYYTTLD